MKIIERKLKFKSKLKKLNSPSMIIIHHSAHSSATVKDIHRWHLENGWSGFGYHFLVTKDGQVHRGRPENAIGVHTNGYNNISLGVCMQGNYDVEKVPQIQFNALIELCKYLCNKYTISTIT
jgi:N-acetyl-anhydromuramyl-L-alanine amidase AmpD